MSQCAKPQNQKKYVIQRLHKPADNRLASPCAQVYVGIFFMKGLTLRCFCLFASTVSAHQIYLQHICNWHITSTCSRQHRQTTVGVDIPPYHTHTPPRCGGRLRAKSSKSSTTLTTLIGQRNNTQPVLADMRRGIPAECDVQTPAQSVECSAQCTRELKRVGEDRAYWATHHFQKPIQHGKT